MRPAEAQAKALLEEFRIKSIPVNVYFIAERLNIEVSDTELDPEVSGVLVVKNGRASIGINSAHHPNRRRFTLAHELGHFALHKPKSGVFVEHTVTFNRDQQSSNGASLEEIQANAFAAELLMPEMSVREAVDGLDLYDQDVVSRLASKFEVSELALSVRLINLGLVAI